MFKMNKITIIQSNMYIKDILAILKKHKPQYSLGTTIMKVFSNYSRNKTGSYAQKPLIMHYTL